MHLLHDSGSYSMDFSKLHFVSLLWVYTVQIHIMFPWTCQRALGHILIGTALCIHCLHLSIPSDVYDNTTNRDGSIGCKYGAQELKGCSRPKHDKHRPAHGKQGSGSFLPFALHPIPSTLLKCYITLLLARKIHSLFWSLPPPEPDHLEPSIKVPKTGYQKTPLVTLLTSLIKTTDPNTGFLHFSL